MRAPGCHPASNTCCPHTLSHLERPATRSPCQHPGSGALNALRTRTFSSGCQLAHEMREEHVPSREVKYQGMGGHNPFCEQKEASAAVGTHPEHSLGEGSRAGQGDRTAPSASARAALQAEQGRSTDTEKQSSALLQLSALTARAARSAPQPADTRPCLPLCLGEQTCRVHLKTSFTLRVARGPPAASDCPSPVPAGTHRGRAADCGPAGGRCPSPSCRRLEEEEMKKRR